MWPSQLGLNWYVAQIPIWPTPPEIGVFAHTQAFVAFKAGSGRDRGGPYWNRTKHSG